MIEEKYLACPPPDKNTRAPKLKTPPGACDTHAHIFGPVDKYPLSPKRGYNPPECTVEDYFRMHEILGIERGVLVQASAYGTDISSILDALAASGDRLRGVAAVDKDVTDAELARMNEAGIRGIRINLADPGGNPFDSFSRQSRNPGLYTQTLNGPRKPPRFPPAILSRSAFCSSDISSTAMIGNRPIGVPSFKKS